MRPIKESIANKALVLKTLNKHGGLTSQEIAQFTQLTKNQVKVSLHDLKQSGDVYQDGKNYYSAASKFEPFLVHKIWNARLFAGLQL